MMVDLLSRSNQVQSTEWSLHPQVFKQICLKWFTPPVDLFATRLNHKVSLYVSPVPDQNAWDIDALNINWSGLAARVSYRCMFKTATLVYKFLHSGSPSYFQPFLSLSSCSYSTRHSHPDHQYLTVPPFRSSVFKSVQQFDHSFAFDAPKIWNELPYDVPVQHQLPPSERSLKLTCLQKPILHSLSCHPVSPWFELAMSSD